MIGGERDGSPPRKTRPAGGTAPSQPDPSIRRVRASDVLGSRGILQIEHEGEVYTLRLTRNNRLILTK